MYQGSKHVGPRACTSSIILPLLPRRLNLYEEATSRFTYMLVNVVVGGCSAALQTTGFLCIRSGFFSKHVFDKVGAAQYSAAQHSNHVWSTNVLK